MDFSEALRLIKRGKAVTRRGWNGNRIDPNQLPMFLHFVKPKDYSVEPDSPLSNAQPIGSQHGMDSFIAMRVKDGTSRPWLASQADLLSDDWEQVFEDRD